jgi:UPF0042 nucleotide-binding protein
MSDAKPKQREPRPSQASPKKDKPASPELVIVTGLSGSGKGTVLKAFEDLGFYCVDHLPIELVGKFADLTREAKSAKRAALVIDIREGDTLRQFPSVYNKLRHNIKATLLFLDADDEVLQLRFSETRRPHPLGTDDSVLLNIREERNQLAPIRAMADLSIDTSKLNVHDLRALIMERFDRRRRAKEILVYVNSFGFRNGVPPESDLVFDVRFLPNPNYIPEFKPLSGLDPSVARYIRSFPQTTEFMDRITELLVYLLPHYIREGKSYLTISIGCTGGQHRSVMIAHEIYKRLKKAGHSVKESHRDVQKVAVAKSPS